MRWPRLRFGTKTAFALLTVAAVFAAWYSGRISFQQPRQSLVADFAGKNCDVFEWKLSRSITSVEVMLDGKSLGKSMALGPLVVPKPEVHLMIVGERDGSARVYVNLARGVKTSNDLPAISHATTASHFVTNRWVRFEGDKVILYTITWVGEDGKPVRTLELVANA